MNHSDFENLEKNYDVTFMSYGGQSSTIQVFDTFEIKRQAVNFLRIMALFQMRANTLQKLSCETLQNLPSFCNKKPPIFFSFFISSNFEFLTVDALVPGLC